eukprot:2553576-Rhodomonas_salina.1
MRSYFLISLVAVQSQVSYGRVGRFSEGCSDRPNDRGARDRVNPRISAAKVPASLVIHLHPEIEHRKPQFPNNSYQECGFLCLVSGCSCLDLRIHAAKGPTGQIPSFK